MRAFTIVVAIVLGAGCAARPAKVATPASVAGEKVIELEPLRIDVVTTPEGGQTSHVYDARSLLDDGNEALVLRRYDDALAAYDHLLLDFPESNLKLYALYNSGQALEGKHDWPAAAEKYTRLIDTIPDTPESAEQRKNAHFRAAAVLAEAGRFEPSVRMLERLLDRDDLSAEERLEGLARLGFAHVEMKDFTGGEDILRQAVAYHREVQGTTRLESSYFVAMAQFYLAEIPHQQFLAIPIRYPEEQMHKDAEAKSQLFLLARDRYVKAVEYKNPIWATAAVYQVATMYKEFWDQWMAVPIPADFNPAEAKEYIKQVNEEPQLRHLLEKALFFHEKNVAMARDARVSTGWSEQSDNDAETIRTTLARIEKGDYVKPGTVAAVPSLTPPGPTPDESATQRPPDVYIPPRLDL